MKILRLFALLALGGFPVWAADHKQPDSPPTPSQMLGTYFERQVNSLEGQLDRDIKTKEDWLAKKDEYRRQLVEMMGLDPMPPRTDLKATKTGEFEYEGLVVEKIHFQSMPGLYVTANLYRPKVIDKPLPAVLYVCGHSSMVKNGISYGNKAAFQNHGIWYAKHGFVCIIIDTLGLGEIPGQHHGTASLDRWWWFARGYTPAGVEAWNCIRTLDYLETRSDVDKTRFGIAGISGGGAYSWWLSALDERIKAAVPTAGITDLHNYVVDGCVEHHCDCMFFVNTYRWDYDKVAALVAPRALCIANSDKDMYFPIDGVFRVYQHARRIYKLLDDENHVGIQFNEGPHMDTQPLNTGEFHWMMRFLQDAPRTAGVDTTMHKGIEIEKLRVFTDLPQEERNSTIDQTFVPLAVKPLLPQSQKQWDVQRDKWMTALREKCFRGWPAKDTTACKAGESPEKDGIQFSSYDLLIEDCFPVRLLIAHRAGLKPQDLDLVVLNVLDESEWSSFAGTYTSRFPALFPGDLEVKTDEKAFEGEKQMFANFKWGMAYVCPRGIGPTRWDNDAEHDTAHPREAAAAKKQRVERWRRFYLIGQTLEGQQVWDIRCAIHALRSIEALKDKPLWLQASGDQAGNALYASLFEENITRLDLHGLPHSHMQGPIYLNVLKYLDIPAAAAMAAEKTRVVIYDDDKAAWDFPSEVSEALGWSKEKKNGIQLRNVPKVDSAQK